MLQAQLLRLAVLLREQPDRTLAKLQQALFSSNHWSEESRQVNFACPPPRRMCV